MKNCSTYDVISNAFAFFSFLNNIFIYYFCLLIVVSVNIAENAPYPRNLFAKNFCRYKVLRFVCINILQAYKILQFRWFFVSFPFLSMFSWSLIRILWMIVKIWYSDYGPFTNWLWLFERYKLRAGFSHQSKPWIRKLANEIAYYVGGCPIKILHFLKSDIKSITCRSKVKTTPYENFALECSKQSFSIIVYDS